LHVAAAKQGSSALQCAGCVRAALSQLLRAVAS